MEDNERVQECLTKAKLARKQVVRYIQVRYFNLFLILCSYLHKLVENEDVIGTLIETNDRIMSALELYQNLCGAKISDNPDTETVTARMAAATITPKPISHSESADTKGKERNDNPGYVHPDLEDLSFGALGNSSNNLPPPMRPYARQEHAYDDEVPDNRGSLSDFSDYESSDEETHKNATGSSYKRNFVTVSDDEDNDGRASASGTSKTKSHVEEDDPFADPFADR